MLPQYTINRQEGRERKEKEEKVQEKQ